MTKRAAEQCDPIAPSSPKPVIVLVERSVSVIGAALKRLKGIDGEAGQSIDATSCLGAVRHLREQLSELDRLAPGLAELESSLSERSDRQFLEMESSIRESCTRRGWLVEGQWPTLYLQRGIALEIDEAKRSVAVGGKRLDGASIAKIIEALEPLIRDLVPQTFSEKAFIAALAAAYDDARKDSTQAPLFDVYKAFVINSQGARFWRNAGAAGFNGVSTDQFRARLSASLERGTTATPDGREIRLLPPLNPRDGLFLYQPAEGRYGFVGRLEFIPLRRPEGLAT